MSGWSSGLCECGQDCSICCLALIAPCAIAGMNADTLNKNPFLWCFVYFLCEPISGAILRQEIRQRYNIDGTCCEDCCLHCWCAPCALRQEYTELKNPVTSKDMIR